MQRPDSTEAELAANALAGSKKARAALKIRMEELASKIIALYGEPVPVNAALEHFDVALRHYGNHLEDPSTDKPYKFSTYFIHWMQNDIEKYLGLDR